MNNKQELQIELDSLQREFKVARDDLINSNVYKTYESLGAKISNLLKQLKEL